MASDNLVAMDSPVDLANPDHSVVINRAVSEDMLRVASVNPVAIIHHPRTADSHPAVRTTTLRPVVSPVASLMVVSAMAV